MSGETEKEAFGWTLDTLNRHLMHVINDADRRYEQRFVAMQDAIVKAERATELRFESVNEFRQTLSEQAGTFMTLAAFNEFNKASMTYRESVNARFEQINNRLNMREGELAGSRSSHSSLRENIGVVISIATAIGAFVAFVVSFIMYFLKG